LSFWARGIIVMSWKVLCLPIADMKSWMMHAISVQPLRCSPVVRRSPKNMFSARSKWRLSTFPEPQGSVVTAGCFYPLDKTYQDEPRTCVCVYSSTRSQLWRDFTTLPKRAKEYPLQTLRIELRTFCEPKHECCKVLDRNHNR
jgi:hypothetical protein